MTTIYLASSSPRRTEILKSVGIKSIILPTDVNEIQVAEETPYQFVSRMAIEKNHSALNLWQKNNGSHLRYPIISADTIVSLKGEIIGKPKSSLDAKMILKKLSNTKHDVLTSVCIYWQGKTKNILQENKIIFKKLSNDEIQNYINTGEPMDKAGAYGIQGIGGIFIKEIVGSYTGIMGLPIYETIELLNDLNYDISISNLIG